MTKRIAVIGAGASGMTATKACLEQGFDVVVFERTSYTGGLWRYQEKLDENGTASVMKSTIINSSKEMSAFSDFPPPPEYPNYMHNSKMVNYFDMYAAKFNFLSYVQFQTEIVSVKEADNFDQSGRWVVCSRNLDTLDEKYETFDGVMICTGHHGTVNQPTFKGQEVFKGTIIHTHSLKNNKGFEDKNVVVVGIGNSGSDAAVELSLVAKQVYLSTRRGTWVSKRVGTNGLPSDQYFHRRFVWFLAQFIPYSIKCSIQEKALNKVFDHEEYQLKPKHRVTEQHVCVNDSLPNCILSGRVAVKSDISHFTEDGVVFKGETDVTKCDAVVMATGYKIIFPYLSQDILPVKENKVRLYKHQFVPHLKHPHTLALIGLIQPIGAILPISEMQSRWFAQLMAGNLKLPSVEQMEKDIKAKEEEMAWRYYASERHTVQVDWLPFITELAREVGVNPPIWKYFFTDQKLFYALVFGPSAAYQFRLVGPHPWSGAREAMLTIKDRITASLHTNSTKGKPAKKSGSFSGKLVISVGFFSLLYFVCIRPCPPLSNHFDKLTSSIQFDFLPKLPFH